MQQEAALVAEAVGQAFALDLPWPNPSDGSTTPQVPPLTRHLSSKACTKTPLMALMCINAAEAVGSAFALDLPWPGPSDGSTTPQVPPLTRHPSAQACAKTPLMALLCKGASYASGAEGQAFAVDLPWPEPSHGSTTSPVPPLTRHSSAQACAKTRGREEASDGSDGSVVQRCLLCLWG